MANKTGVDFVTCDHPAVLTNRYHFQKLQQTSFGVANSGAIISMPLSPRLSLMAYDTGVYTIPNASGTSFVDLTRDADVRAFNQLQYLSAGKNIYFRRWEDADRIASETAAVSEIRAASGPVSRVLVRDYEADGPGESYRKGTAEEEITAKETIVTTSTRQSDPGNWPSVMKFRDQTFSNGSAVGHVRQRQWLSGRGR